MFMSNPIFNAKFNIYIYIHHTLQKCSRQLKNKFYLKKLYWSEKDFFWCQLLAMELPYHVTQYINSNVVFVFYVKYIDAEYKISVSII